LIFSSGPFTELGIEQLGQRGCASDSVALMDIDLVSRLISAEELKLKIGLLLRNLNHTPPVSWWDRSCDIALLIGTFVHGLGNYEAMKNDNSLPFVKKLECYAKTDPLATEAQTNFLQVTKTAAKVCEDAFEASKMKAQREIQKAVAAAAAARDKIEEDAAALRTGGSAAEAVSNRMGEPRVDNLYEIVDGQDDHFITLPRLKTSIKSAIQPSFHGNLDAGTDAIVTETNGNQVEAVLVDESKGRKRNALLRLPFPDARVLNCRLRILLGEIERGNSSRNPNTGTPGRKSFGLKIWPRSDKVSASVDMRNVGLAWTLDLPPETVTDHVIEYTGIGLNGSQCEVTHRTMDDKNDYSIGAASTNLAHIATGPDSHRYLRALGVPMTFGRFGLSALVHANESCLKRLLENERDLYYGNGKNTDEKSDDIKEYNPSSASEKKEEKAGDDRCTSSGPITQDSNEVVANGDSTASDRKGGTSTRGWLDIVPATFQGNDALRAAVCVVLLYNGCPLINDNDGTISSDVTRLLLQNDGIEDDSSSTPKRFHLFGTSKFLSLLKDICKDTELPSIEAIGDYIHSCLLPHCLKLSLYGNGSTTWEARGSKGEFETASGTSKYQEPSDMLQSPLPDPCLPLGEQSVEALGAAVAMIRRVKLMKCSQDIATGKVKPSILTEILHSQKIRQSMNGLPVWWCPWIHDLALLVHASSMGLFSIFKDRMTSAAGPVFSQDAILQHTRSTFPDANEEWINSVVRQFPTMNVLERRLAFVCALATEGMDGDNRFDNIPMFDHGGWPRN
jgi:hypothetical protein